MIAQYLLFLKSGAVIAQEIVCNNFLSLFSWGKKQALEMENGVIL